MALIRTPDERFKDLPAYPFTPNYLEWNGARMHYLDEGTGDVILCLHGEPSWSFLYRKMIPILSRKGRVIAPDLIGFGKSDKFTEPEDYTFQMHRDAVLHLLDALGLDRITLVGQDWGGLIGLRLVGEQPERFARLALANAALATGDLPVSKGFSVWRDFAARSKDLEIGLLFRQAIVDEACKTDEIIRAYEAPFPDRRYKAGALRFPLLVPLAMDDPGAAELRRSRDVLSRWDKPAFVAGSDQDQILGLHAAAQLAKIIPTAGDVVVIEGAGHFLQEEKGEELATRIAAFIDEHPIR